MIKRTVKHFLVFLIPALFIYTFSLYNLFEFLEARENNTGFWKGKSLPSLSFVDKENRSIEPDFESSEFSVVDFWYVGCPSCIVEMKTFDNHLSKSSGRLKIYSVSVDRFKIWHKFVGKPEEIKNKELKFLAKPNAFWVHLFPKENLNTEDNYMEEAKQKFQVTRYPTYFILDREGKIVTVTNHFQKFIQTTIEGKSGYLLFLKNLGTWQYKKKAIAIFLLAYPILIFGLLLIIRRRKT